MTAVRPEQALQMAADARERAAKTEAEAEHATTVAVLMGQQAGISLRDMAVLLGISHQRVAKIAAVAGCLARLPGDLTRSRRGRLVSRLRRAGRAPTRGRGTPARACSGSPAEEKEYIERHLAAREGAA